jgi:hypothetical protein
MTLERRLAKQQALTAASVYISRVLRSTSTREPSAMKAEAGGAESVSTKFGP